MIIGTGSAAGQAIATAVIVAIIAGMLGGCVYQLDTVSTTVNHVGHIVPQAWAMDAFVKLIYDHATFADTLPQIGALAVFAVVLSALAVWYYSRRSSPPHEIAPRLPSPTWPTRSCSPIRTPVTPSSAGRSVLPGVLQGRRSAAPATPS